jgi:DNA topoisomerase-1
MKHLIIVESPAKAKTISNFLSKDYKVVASKGHIRDLPATRFGIDVTEEQKFIPKYSISKENRPSVKELKEYAKKSETIYLATDEDREGEAIGFHIAEAIGRKPDELPRIVFHEITKKAIQKALENPRKIDMNLVNAQQTRRLLDRIVGYKLSPLLSSKIQRGLSAGRVQSASLKIVVDREREIQNFKPQEYWELPTLFEKNLDSVLTIFNNQKLEKLSIKNEQEATEIFELIKKIDSEDGFFIAKLETKERKMSSPAPFMTSTLQQTASNKLGFSPKKTMMLAQKLYEGVPLEDGTQVGLITYMRTDSLNLSEDAVESAREMISINYGKKYLPEKPKQYTSKSKGAQEAHEAIRPTVVEYTPESIKKSLDKDLFKLYSLIYDRFIACQMENAIFSTSSALINNHNIKQDLSNKIEYKSTGKKLIFDGFYKVLGYDEKDKLLPDLAENENIKIVKIDKIQKFTEPPKRYSEAGLVKKLESLGIGRPSTYAPTISTLTAREYIKIEKKQLHATEIGINVTTVLEQHFTNIVNQEFTATMEKTLDEVATDKKDWQEILKEFYFPFMELIEAGKKNIKSQKVAIELDRECPECGEKLLLRKGRFGEFIACSGFPKCRFTENVKKEGEEENPKPKPIESDEVCEKCGSKMLIREGRNGKFLSCSAYPKCKNTKSLEKPKIIEGAKCPDCGGNIVEKRGRKNIFYGCENYPKCKFTSKFKPTPKKCDKCGTSMVEREFHKKEIYECLNSECKNRIPRETAN